MKITALLTAIAVGATGLAPAALTTPASAQRTVVTERTVVHTQRGHRAHRRTVCRIEHRGRRDVRICRTVYR